MPETDVTQDVQPGSGEETTVPDTSGSDAGQGAFEYDGEKFTPEQLAEAIEAWRDRNSWEAAFKQRDQKHAAARTAIESGMGKKMHDLDQSDLRDLQAFGLINQRLRTEPAFAKAWEESLIDAYKKAGATPAEARSAAKEAVADAKTGQKSEQPNLPPDVLRRLERVDSIEEMMLEQGMTQFRGVLENDVKAQVTKYAGDLERFHPMVRMGILQGIAAYTDVELLEKYQSGELQRELGQLAKSTAKTLREHLGQKQAAVGEAVNKAKANAAPAPTKGSGTAERVEGNEPKPGKGLRGMTDRLLGDMGGRVKL